MKKPLLSLVIPTYNRACFLKETIEVVEQQFNDSFLEHIEFIIIDNDSNDNTIDLVHSISALDRIPSIVYIKNKINIGLVANVCKCFEVSTGKWLWLLGDDDIPDAAALATIINILNKIDEGVAYVNFSSNIYAHTSSLLMTEAPFWNYMSNGNRSSNVLFISTGCYRRDHIMPDYRFAYQYASTGAPHVVLVAAALRRGFKAFVSDYKLIYRKPEAAEERWSDLLITQGLVSLPEIPFTTQQFTRFSKYLVSQAAPKTKRCLRLLLLSDIPSWYLIQYFSRLRHGVCTRDMIKMLVFEAIAFMFVILPFVRLGMGKCSTMLFPKYCRITVESGLSRT